MARKSSSSAISCFQKSQQSLFTSSAKPSSSEENSCSTGEFVARRYETWRSMHYLFLSNLPYESIGSCVPRNEDPSLIYLLITINPALATRPECRVRTEIFRVLVDCENYNVSHIEAEVTITGFWRFYGGIEKPRLVALRTLVGRRTIQLSNTHCKVQFTMSNHF